MDRSDQAVQISELQDMFTQCIDRSREDKQGLDFFRVQMKALKDGIYENVSPENYNPTNGDVIGHLLGQVEDVDVSCSNPQGIRNKGCGTNKRLIGPGEKVVAKKKKAPRLCRTCGEYTDHDSRNCPLKVREEDA